jgi:hypothetical protein
LLNADQHFGHRRFPRKSFSSYHIADCATWLPLAVIGRFWRLAGTISGTVAHELRRSHIWQPDPPDVTRHKSLMNAITPDAWGVIQWTMVSMVRPEQLRT